MADRDTLILRSIKNKALEGGFEALSDAELVSLSLRKGDSINDVLALSENLLKRYQSLNMIYEIPCETLLRENRGLNEQKILHLKASLVLGKRAAAVQMRGKKISSARDVFDNMKEEMGCLRKEHFRVVLLNIKNTVMSSEEISIGTLSASLVHAREVFRTAIISNSYSLILIHNHPSNDPNPSQDDRNVTQYLKEAGDLIGIKVLDHVIICSDSYFSFADSNIL